MSPDTDYPARCFKLFYAFALHYYGIMSFKIHLFTEHQILLAAQKMCTASEIPHLDSLVSAPSVGTRTKNQPHALAWGRQVLTQAI